MDCQSNSGVMTASGALLTGLTNVGPVVGVANKVIEKMASFVPVVLVPLTVGV